MFRSSTGNRNAQLSKNVLEMKFMQRTKEKYEKDQFEAKQRALFSTSLTQKLEGKQATQKRFIHERSFVPCADLVAGRMSFKGRNPLIEKLTAQEETEDPHFGEMGGIDDVEFAERYSSTVDTMSKKFIRKRDRSQASIEKASEKKKLKKPRIDDN
ncbi:M-phase phosphoprotein 6-like [Varroa jacobsoni]|uniref:M-phase phosphoprotein 6 n=1 Tax=Varroa destructor TaxID=109461 RepID=A0A7M7MHK8_VARDE|nr:M-phase phosphoprotein 6-like [Varroa destructor]XP_022709178.1 M-phase phosphoprotein 6-like [Varroa jacobsoni]